MQDSNIPSRFPALGRGASPFVSGYTWILTMLFELFYIGFGQAIASFAPNELLASILVPIFFLFVVVSVSVSVNFGNLFHNPQGLCHSSTCDRLVANLLPFQVFLRIGRPICSATIFLEIVDVLSYAISLPPGRLPQRCSSRTPRPV